MLDQFANLLKKIEPVLGPLLAKLSAHRSWVLIFCGLLFILMYALLVLRRNRRRKQMEASLAEERSLVERRTKDFVVPVPRASGESPPPDDDGLSLEMVQARAQEALAPPAPGPTKEELDAMAAQAAAERAALEAAAEAEAARDEPSIGMVAAPPPSVGEEHPPATAEEAMPGQGGGRVPFSEILKKFKRIQDEIWFGQRAVLEDFENLLDMQAIEEAEAALVEDPDNTKLLDWLAFMYYTNDFVDKAIECYKHLIEIKPEAPDFFFFLGNCFYKVNLLPEAIFCWDVVMGMNSSKKMATRAERSIENAKTLVSQWSKFGIDLPITDPFVKEMADGGGAMARVQANTVIAADGEVLPAEPASAYPLPPVAAMDTLDEEELRAAEALPAMGAVMGSMGGVPGLPDTNVTAAELARAEAELSAAIAEEEADEAETAAEAAISVASPPLGAEAELLSLFPPETPAEPEGPQASPPAEEETLPATGEEEDWSALKAAFEGRQAEEPPSPTEPDSSTEEEPSEEGLPSALAAILARADENQEPAGESPGVPEIFPELEPQEEIPVAAMETGDGVDSRDETPHGEEAEPEDGTAYAEEPESVVEETEEIPEETVPLVEETEEIPEETVPLVEETEYIDEETAPLVEETEYIDEETAPLVEETEIVDEETAPLVGETEVVDEETAPLVEETEYIDEETAPLVEETEYIDEETAPLVEETEIVDEETAPLVGETEDVPEETAPLVEETEYIDEETAPLVEETEYIDEETAPLVEETEIVAEETAPLVEETEVIDEETAPLVEETEDVPEETEELIATKAPSVAVFEEEPLPRLHAVQGLSFAETESDALQEAFDDLFQSPVAEETVELAPPPAPAVAPVSPPRAAAELPPPPEDPSLPIWTASKLEGLLEHEDLDVRRWAARRLVEFHPEQAEALVPDMIRSDDEETRIEAIRLVGTRGLGRFALPIARLLPDASEALALAAIATLGELGYREAVPRFMDRLEKRGSQVELAAVLASLGKMGSKAAGKEIVAMLHALADVDSVTKGIDALFSAQGDKALDAAVHKYLVLDHGDRDRSPVLESFVTRARVRGLMDCILEVEDPFADLRETFNRLRDYGGASSTASRSFLRSLGRCCENADLAGFVETLCEETFGFLEDNHPGLQDDASAEALERLLSPRAQRLVAFLMAFHEHRSHLASDRHGPRIRMDELVFLLACHAGVVMQGEYRNWLEEQATSPEGRLRLVELPRDDVDEVLGELSPDESLLAGLRSGLSHDEEPVTFGRRLRILEQALALDDCAAELVGKLASPTPAIRKRAEELLLARKQLPLPPVVEALERRDAPLLRRGLLRVLHRHPTRGVAHALIRLCPVLAAEAPLEFMRCIRVLAPLEILPSLRRLAETMPGEAILDLISFLERLHGVEAPPAEDPRPAAAVAPPASTGSDPTAVTERAEIVPSPARSATPEAEEFLSQGSPLIDLHATAPVSYSWQFYAGSTARGRETLPAEEEDDVTSSSEDPHGSASHEVEKVGRNAPCPCGSGKKYKKCCGRNR